MVFPDISAVTCVSGLPAEALKRAVTVYGSSSSAIADVYKDAAFELGALIAAKGLPLVSGGGREGLMGSAIEGAAGAGGITIGILPQFMIERRWEHPRLSQIIGVADMHTRKAMMAALASAAIAMPGGIGTFDELFEIITWRQLGLWEGRVIILNTEGYYAPLLEMLGKAGREHFMRRPGGMSDELYAVASTPAEAVSLLKPC